MLKKKIYFFGVYPTRVAGVEIDLMMENENIEFEKKRKLLENSSSQETKKQRQCVPPMTLSKSESKIFCGQSFSESI